MDRDEALREIVRRIVEVAKPQRIILFGSAARGEMGRDSDFDLLIIKPGVSHCRRLAQQIRQHLWGIEHAVDLVVATPEDIELYGDCPALIYRSALREGRAIYDESEAVPAG